MRLFRLPVLCALLTLTGASSARAEPDAMASPQEVQAYAFDLVNVGEFSRAREMFERLAGMTGEPLAKAAWFHWGNLLENHAMMDARTLDEVRQTLKEAHEAHNRAMVRLQAGPPDEELPHLRNRLKSHLQVVEEHQNALERIQNDEMNLIEAAETIDDMNAPAAAAGLLRPRLDSGEPGADQFYFLSLIYNLSYIDHLYLRLRNMWQAAAQPENDLLSEGARAEGLDRLHRATEAASNLAAAALREFGGSPHWLDYLTFSADIHRYQGLLNLMRADLARDGLDQAALAREDPGSGFEADALEHFQELIEDTRKIIAFTDEALEDRSQLSEAQAGAYSDSVLERYGTIARQTLEDSTGLTETVPLRVEPDITVENDING